MLMGGFVTAYNYLGYRLTTRPFGLASSMVGLLCLTGSGTSIVAGRRQRMATEPCRSAAAEHSHTVHCDERVVVERTGLGRVDANLVGG